MEVFEKIERLRVVFMYRLFMPKGENFIHDTKRGEDLVMEEKPCLIP